MYQGRTIRDRGNRATPRGNTRAFRRPARAVRTTSPAASWLVGRVMRLLALAGLVVAGLFLGCTFFASKEPAAPPPPSVMSMTDPAVSELLGRVETAKASQRRPEGFEEYVRYVATVYVEPIRLRYAVAETVDAAVRQADLGDAPAGRFLAGTVRDVQLLAAMEGRTFTVDQWREIYVRSGLMAPDTFARLGGDMPQNPALPEPSVPGPRPDPALEAASQPGEGENP